MTETVQLFITCIMDTLYPETGESVVRVLERAGVEVAFPSGQTCCGQPAFNAGLRNQARQMAMHTIEVFEAAPGPVVIPSGSCAAMLRHSYLELFADDPGWLPRRKRWLLAPTSSANSWSITWALRMSAHATRARSPITPPVTCCARSASTASRACCCRQSEAPKWSSCPALPNAAALAACFPSSTRRFLAKCSSARSPTCKPPVRRCWFPVTAAA